MCEASLPLSPTALILCSDARLYRLLEIELAHLGIEAVAEWNDDRRPCLLIADTDEVPIADALAQARRASSLLLAFGYGSVLPAPSEGVYIRRPFLLSELEDRLRRMTAEATAHAQGTRPTPLQTAQIPSAALPTSSVFETEMVFEGNSVVIGGLCVPLSSVEMTILRCLFDRRGEIVSRETLAELASGGKNHYQSNTVDAYVYHLRRKMEKPLGRRLISTVRGRGYRLE